MPEFIFSGASPAPSSGLILDPAAVATEGRKEVSLNSEGIEILAEGVEIGEQTVTPYMAEATYGEPIVDYRLPNRTIKVPLRIKAGGLYTFDENRVRLEQKVSLINTQGGWLQITQASGRIVYADLVQASLSLSMEWLTEHRETDVKAHLELVALPDFYGPEVEGTEHEGTGDLAFTEQIGGNLPARVVSLRVEDKSGHNQLGLLWHARSRNYSSLSTAKWAYNAEELERLDLAELATLAGSYGTKVVKHPSLSTGWTPIHSTNLAAGTYLTHAGLSEVWARVYSTSAELPWLRFVWDEGDIVAPTENTQVRVPWASNFYLVNLGQVNLQRAPFGEQRWRGVIQGRGEKGGENVSIDRLWFVCADEVSGTLAAPSGTINASSSFVARDEFNQAEGGNLEGMTLPVGGTWSEASKTGASGFQVNNTSHVAERTSKSDAATNGGSYAIAGTGEHAATKVRVTVSSTALISSFRFGVLARYHDTFDWLGAFFTGLAPGVKLQVIKRKAGTETTLGTALVSWKAENTVELQVLADGTWEAVCNGVTLLTGFDEELATGGVLGLGKVGMYDAWTSAEAGTRTYDNFAAWAPEADAVIFAKKSARLATNGMYRQSEDGKGYGPVAVPGSDLPRLPVSGPEAQPVEISLKPSRGVPGETIDGGKDALKTQLIYRPCWSFVPSS